MILSLFLCIHLVSSQATSPSWGVEYVKRHHVLAKTAATGLHILRNPRQEARGVPGQANTSLGMGDARLRPYTEADALRDQTLHRIYLHLGNLERQERWEDVYWAIKDFQITHPDVKLWPVDVAASAFYVGRYLEAENILTAFLSQSTSHDRYSPGWIELSLALSAQGKAVAGQAAYVEDILHENFLNGGAEDEYSPPAVNDTDMRSTRILSLLGLGFQGGSGSQFYLKSVLRLDPSNVMAARESMEEYGFSAGRYTDERAVGNAILPLLKPGKTKQWFIDELARVDGLPDKPLRLEPEG
jgi:hypothetical protein